MSAWILNKKQSGYHTIKRDEGYLPMVADVYGTDEEARLIAAAPDLLALALRLVETASLCRDCEWDVQKHELIQLLTGLESEAKEAINKTKTTGGE
jgi:hypothetical protein